MATITKNAIISIETNSTSDALYISELTAGSALPAAAACYIDSAGLVQLSASTIVSTGSLTQFAGFTAKAYQSGDAIGRLFGQGSRFSYGTAMVPGTMLYIDSAGELKDVPTAGDVPTAMVVSSTDIVVVR
jgi:hypothetical protein